MVLLVVLVGFLFSLPASAVSVHSRDSAKDFALAAENGYPTGLWSDGTTMWVADFEDAKLYAYNMPTESRDPGKDFTLATDNSLPVGIWSDGTTMWVVDFQDAKLYAYSMATRARDSGKDFDTLRAAGNLHPEDIWSDGITMWVGDIASDKLYAYSLSTKARDSGKDFDTLRAAGNGNPIGMWSDGVTMWVADWGDIKAYAYSMSTSARDAGKDFTLAAGNDHPEGMWSDGTTMWVADREDDKLDGAKLYAYAMPPGVIVDPTSLTVAEGGSGAYTMALNAAPTADVTVDITAGSDVSVDPTSVTFDSSNWSAAQTVTVSAAHDDDAADDTVTLLHSASTTDSDYLGISVADVPVTTTDDDSAGVTVSVPTLTVAEGGSGAYTMALDAAPTAAVTVDITAGGDVSVDPTSVTFDSSNWSATQTVTVSAAADDDETNDIQTVSHSIDSGSASEYAALTNLADVEVTVTDAAVCSASASPFAYTCHKHFTLAADNEDPAGIWSDGTTMWVADGADRKLYAYNLPAKARGSGKDFTTLDARNILPAGIWSDGTTMWVAERSIARLYAYRMSDGERSADRDFDTLRAAGNTAPRGIWSDGTTMWVADASDDKLYAYDKSTKARDSDKDFDTLSAAGNDNSQGIWADGVTIWVADASDGRLYAYDMFTKARDSDKDFDALSAAGNDRPAGIWADGVTIWVADASDEETYAYNMPGGVSTVSTVSIIDDAPLASLTSAEPAVADPLWSARLTVGSYGAAVGFDLFVGMGSLSARSFRIDGPTPSIVVGSLYVDGGGNLYFGISNPMPTAFTLDVGGFQLSSQDAGISQSDVAHRYRWTAGELSLSVGDHVDVSLVVADAADVEPELVAAQRSQPTDSPGTKAATISKTVQVDKTITVPLTASLESLPDSHDGTGAFIFKIRFSENVKLGFRRMRDHAFEVTGGTITNAKRLEQGSNIGWRIRVMPSPDSDVDIVLPVTTDCRDRAAVCTHDGRMLSKELSFTIPGPEPQS